MKSLLEIGPEYLQIKKDRLTGSSGFILQKIIWKSSMRDQIVRTSMNKNIFQILTAFFTSSILT